jgi:hypothetical protein
MKIPGLSYSWKRATGISSVKQRISKRVGIPMTKGGVERKIGSFIIKMITSLLRGGR